MVTAKLAFALIQVGSNLWVNPMQIQGIRAWTSNTDCQTIIITAGMNSCSDWSFEEVKKALGPAVVAKAMEAAR